MNKKTAIIFMISVVILSLLSFWRAFSFDFWRDDWSEIWASINHPYYLYSWGIVVAHPISALNRFVLTQFFGWNPKLWEIYGFILRIIDSFFVFLFTYSITRSKRAGFFAGLIFAAMPIGIEGFDWSSANTVALLIPIFCAAVWFWQKKKSDKSGKSKLLSWLFVIISIFADPFRGLSLLLFLLLFDRIEIIQKTKKLPKLPPKKVILLILFLLISAVLFSSSGKYIMSEYSSRLRILFYTNTPIIIIRKIYNFFLIPFNITGNLFAGWILPTVDIGDVSARSYPSIFVGIAIIYYVVKTIIQFLKYKTKNQQIILALFCWIGIMYFPNWLADPSLIPGITNRYLLLSSLGATAILALLISKLSPKRGIFCLIIVLTICAITSNNVLADEYLYRSTASVESLWTQINHDVGKNQYDIAFLYQGQENSFVIRTDLVAAYSIPFGVMRGETKLSELPLATESISTVGKMVCEGNFIPESKYSGTALHKNKIPLSHVYSWNYNSFLHRLINTSSATRLSISKIKSCKFTN